MASELRKVTKKEFFATVGQMNVHPRSEANRSVWETPDRRVMGITTPGYLCVGEATYAIAVAAKVEG